MRVAPAEAAHVLAMLTAPAPRLTLPPSVYRLVLGQLALSEAYAFFADDAAPAPVVIGGLAPIGDGDRDCWFLVSPAAARHMRRFVRLARGILAERTGCICFVRPENRQGRRLAALLGFEPEAVLIGRHQRWRRI
ncbi:MAG: hypothetical protein WCZ28_06290 [Burkholderiaceae bacterium]